MNHTPTLFWLALVCAPVAAVGCILLALVAWRARLLAIESLALAAELNGRLTIVEKKLEAVTRQVTEQTRRFAGSELRKRRVTIAFDPDAEDKLTDAAPPGMTERRHRVLALARRGMEPALIAETLGVPYGEVELIISLSAA